MTTVTSTAAGRKKATTANSSSATPSESSAAVVARLSTHRSWTRSLLIWGVLLPVITILLAITIPLTYKYARMPVGRPFSIISNQTVIHKPSNFHSRYRGADYVGKYDRFFFQWWNFLVYDAETHDHWTIVYHATSYSKAANYPDYASASIVHKTGPAAALHAHDAVPLADLIHDRDWDLSLRKPDGSTPYTMTIIDDDTYNVVGYAPKERASDLQSVVSWNLTFHRVHGMYSGLDNEEFNKDNCAIVSTLFGYHSKVSGWIREGDKTWNFTSTGAGASRYRAYAAGSWGCKLPAGYPAIEYPWTWFWLTIPADSHANPPREEIGICMGSAKFQINNTMIGDLYGGYGTVGIGKEMITSTFSSLHHLTPFELPLTKASTDEYLRISDITFDEWVNITDPSGAYSVPLIQRYDLETAHYRFQIDFFSQPEQYFRLPVVVEHVTSAMQADSSSSSAASRLAVFSDFRACGVRTHVRIWHRTRTIAQQKQEKKGGKQQQRNTNDKLSGAAAEQWNEGGWDSVVYDDEVNSLNALEFAYQAPLSAEAYRQTTLPQKFD